MKPRHPGQIKAIVQKLLTPQEEGEEAQTLSEYWESTTSSYGMMTLLGHAYRDGALSRRRLVSVSLRCVETCAHLLPDEVHMEGWGWRSSRAPLECLAKLSSWCAGADDVDLTVVRDTMRGLCWTHRNRLLGNFKHIEDYEKCIGVRYDDAVPVTNLTSALDAALEVADAAGVGHGLGADDAYADAIVSHARFAVVRAGDAFGIGASGALADVIRDELDADELQRVLFGDEPAKEAGPLPVKAYYRTDKRGNVRWHALGKNDRPLCGVGPGEDDDVKEGCSPTDVDCSRCRALAALDGAKETP